MQFNLIYWEFSSSAEYDIVITEILRIAKQENVNTFTDSITNLCDVGSLSVIVMADMNL